MPNSPFFIGIDGGGTRCRAQLQDSRGLVLGVGESGPANIMTNPEQALASVVEASKKAIAASGISIALHQVHVAAGLAGANITTATLRFLALVHPFKTCHVISDLHAACLGAHDGNAGALVICGTGTAATAFKDNTFSDKGGYGLYVGDNGGAAWLGLEAIKHALLVFDGLGEPTLLSGYVCDYLMVSDPNELVEKVASFEASEYGALAPGVFSKFDENCTAATTLVRTGAHYLSTLAREICSVGNLPLCFMGGVGERYLPLLDRDVKDRLCPIRQLPQVGAIRYVKAQLQGVDNAHNG